MARSIARTKKRRYGSNQHNLTKKKKGGKNDHGNKSACASSQKIDLSVVDDSDKGDFNIIMNFMILKKVVEKFACPTCARKVNFLNHIKRKLGFCYRFVW